MEDLSELSNQLDNIKEKISSKEYKDLMELSKKIYDKKNKKYIKCLVGTFKLSYTIDEGDNEPMIRNDADAYCNVFYGDSYDRLQISVQKNINFNDKIYEIRESDTDNGIMTLGEDWMCTQHYENLKKNKYEINNDEGIIIYLNDM